MFDNFGLKVSRIFKNAENEMLSLNHPYVGSEHLLLSILKSDDEINKVLNKNNLYYETFKEELVNVVGTGTKTSEVILYTPLLKRVIDYALSDAKENNNGILTPTHLFLGILEEGEGIAIRLMISMNIDLDKLYQELQNKYIKKEKLLIYEIGKNLNQKVNNDEVVIGRDKEINDIIEILLRKNKNNPLLIGKAGVGKTAIIEELARRINKNLVPEELQNKTIVMLEMSFLISGTKYRGEFEERLTKIINEVMGEDDIILFIDEVHTLVGAGGAEGAIDASNILKPYLARGDIKCIGATTNAEYNKHIAPDKALARRFQLVNVLEPSLTETLEILKGIKPSYEHHHNLKISNNILKDIVSLADANIFNIANPDKSIDILDATCVKTKLKNLNFNNKELELNLITKTKESSVLNKDFNKAIKLRNKEHNLKKELANNHCKKECKITKKEIIEVIKSKTNNYFLDKKELLKIIKQTLNDNLINQDTVKKNIVDAFKNYNNFSSKPLSILLAGGTGVGKTYTAKLISEAISKKDNIIKLDMAEYNNEMSITKLIGTSAGYVGYNDEFIFNSVKNNPYSVIIIDELEKAHKKVLNMLLNILEEGYIKDSKGETIRFDNTIILLTTNNSENNKVGFVNKNKISKLNNELLSRIENIIYFDNINELDVKNYIEKEFNKNKKKLSEDKLKNILIKSEYQKYGLRNVKKEINFV